MSQKSSSSLKNKQNVKIPSAVPTRQSIINSSRFTGGALGPVTSKTGLVSRSSSNLVEECMEKIQSHKPTIRLDTKSIYYDKLKVTSSMQYFRDDWGGVTAIRYFQDVEKVAVGFNSGDLQICTASAQTQMKYVPSETILKGWEGNDSISCIRFHPRKPSMLYASSTAGTVMRRDLEESVNYNDFFISEDNEIFSMDFTSKGELVTVGRDATVRVYDVSGKALHEFGQRRKVSFPVSIGGSRDESYHEKRIYCVRCHPSEPSLLVSGGWDGVRIWDTRLQRACVRRINGPFIFGEAVDICNGMLLTASYAASNSLQLWDLGSGLPISDISPTNKRVYLYGEYPCVAQFFDGDSTGDLVLYGVGGLQLISIKELSILYLFEDEKPVGAVDSKGPRVAFGGKSNSVLYGQIFSPENETSISCSSYASLLPSTVQSTSQKSVDTGS